MVSKLEIAIGMYKHRPFHKFRLSINSSLQDRIGGMSDLLSRLLWIFQNFDLQNNWFQFLKQQFWYRDKGHIAMAMQNQILKAPIAAASGDSSHGPLLGLRTGSYCYGPPSHETIAE